MVYNGIGTPYRAIYRSKHTHRHLAFSQQSKALSRSEALVRPETGSFVNVRPEPDFPALRKRPTQVRNSRLAQITSRYRIVENTTIGGLQWLPPSWFITIRLTIRSQMYATDYFWGHHCC